MLDNPRVLAYRHRVWLSLLFLPVHPPATLAYNHNNHNQTFHTYYDVELTMRGYRLDQPVPGEIDEDRMTEAWKPDAKSKLKRDPTHPQNDPKAKDTPRGTTIQGKRKPYHKEVPGH